VSKRQKLVRSSLERDSQGLVALQTKKLSRVVAGKVLVEDVSVEVRAGEVLAVVGPSGAGKSSFLRLLNRLDEPTGRSRTRTCAPVRALSLTDPSTPAIGKVGRGEETGVRISSRRRSFPIMR